MKPHIADLIAWNNGFRRAHDLLESIRRQEIRESNIVLELASFNIAFASAIELGVPEKSVGLSESERVLFGIKR
jgi:hypothetical protein